VIHIARTFVVEGGSRGPHRDVFVTIEFVVVVIVQMPSEERVVPILEQCLNRRETRRGIFSGRLMQGTGRSNDHGPEGGCVKVITTVSGPLTCVIRNTAPLTSHVPPNVSGLIGLPFTMVVVNVNRFPLIVNEPESE